MIWFFAIVLVIAAIAALLYFGRHWICIRRKDCCGRGCGCLFPKKNPE
jgi:hypothetical protein